MAIFLLFGVAIRALVIWSGLAERGLIADDAYYYFTIARNIAGGLGPTFDTLAPTNGFHPLWLLVLVPVFALFGGYLWIPVKVALSISSVFDIGSGLLIYTILRNKGLHTEASTAAIIWLLAPFTLLLGLRGMEISLSVFVILLLIRYLSANETTLASFRHALVAGFLVGLSGWVRTDNLPILGLALAITILIVERASILRKTFWILLAAVMAFVVVLPWFAWNHTHFGQVMQISGITKSHEAWSFAAIAGELKSLDGIIRVIAYTLLSPITYPSKFLAGEEFRSPGISVFIILALLLLFLMLAAKIQNAWKNSHSTGHFILTFAAIYILTHVLLYGVILRFYAVWYALPFYAMLCILIGIVWQGKRSETSRQGNVRRMTVPAVVVFNLAIYLLFFARVPTSYSASDDYYGPTLEIISRDYSGGAIIGAFNAGAPGYIAPEYGKLKVVNLDMLVNNDAYKALKQGHFLDYIAQTIDVFIEDPRLAASHLSPEETEILCALYTRPDTMPYWRKFMMLED